MQAYDSMAMAAGCRLVVLAVLALPLLLQTGLASDPDPVSDFTAGLTSFTFRDVFTNGNVAHGPGGTRATADTSIFPAMEIQSLNLIQFKLKPCGVNPPHIHPRSSEILTLVKGGPLQVGFVDTQGVPHIDILHPGDITIFPRGLLHYELNVGKHTAMYVQAQNSQNPGVLRAAGALLNVPLRALVTALNATLAEVQTLEEIKLVYGSTPQLAPSFICTPGKDITTAF